MIRIDGDHISGNLRHDIERLEALLTDLRRLASGHFPSTSELADAPVLDEYVLGRRELPCLAGIVYGHPGMRDGHLITTSDLWMFAPDQRWARTLSRVYTLGRHYVPDEQS